MSATADVDTTRWHLLELAKAIAELKAQLDRIEAGLKV